MKFIVTDELGRLVTWLRILGFDTVLEKNRAALVWQGSHWALVNAFLDRMQKG